jgi:hypothetical protein
MRIITGLELKRIANSEKANKTVLKELKCCDKDKQITL